MKDRIRKPSTFSGVGLALASIGFAVVVLSSRAADRWAIAVLLLVGVPLVVAMGGASDEAWRALSHHRADALAAPPAGVRRASIKLGRTVAGASGVIHLALAVLVVRFAIRAWGNHDAALALVLLPMIAFAVWRGVSGLGRLVGERSDPGGSAGK